MQNRFNSLTFILTISFAVLLTACASTETDPSDEMTFEEFRSQYSNETPNIEGLNQQLLSRAVDVGETEGVYRVGPGD